MWPRLETKILKDYHTSGICCKLAVWLVEGSMDLEARTGLKFAKLPRPLENLVPLEGTC